MKSTPARPSFRIATPGHHREDPAAVIRALAEERAQLQKRVADLEAVLQATIEVLQARVSPHPHESDRALLPSESLDEQPESARPFPEKIQAVPSEVVVQRPAAVTSSATHARRPLNRSHRLAFWLVPLLATAAIPGLVYLRAPVWKVAAGARTATVNEPANQAAAPTADSKPQPAVAVVPAPDVRPDLPPATNVAPAVASQRPSDGLTISLHARDRCWIAATLDGQRKLERLMQRGEATILHALDDVVLKTGNAGALSLTINGLAAAPLGRKGQTVTTRITLANYMRLTEQAQHPGRASAKGRGEFGRP